MKKPFFALLALALLPALGGAFPLWLDAPTRSNPHDPKNPDRIRAWNPPAATATPLATLAVPSATPSQTPTQLSTPLPFSPTFSRTASPLVSASFSPSRTPALSATSTRTQPPFSSPSFTPSSTPIVSVAGTATSTPSPTVTPTHGRLVADFESADNSATLWNRGPILAVKDALGSTLSPDPWAAGSASAPGSASAQAACFSGNMIVQIGAPTNQYPYCFLALELLPGGSAPASAGGADTDVDPYSPNHGLKFDYKAGAAGVLYRVKLISTLVTDFAYYEFQFTPTDTAWHTVTVYFPGTPGGSPSFSQPAWGAARAFDATKIGALMFEPVPQTSGPVAYNLCVDNLSFDVAMAPTPVPTPTAGGGTLVADFEDNAANDLTKAPFGKTISTNCDAMGSAILPQPWTAGSGSAPGSDFGGPASSYAGCFSGSLIAQDPPNSVYPYGVMEMLLADSGWGNGGGSVDITPYAPGKRLTFDYKAGVAGVQYGVQIITSNISDYAFYEYLFTPANTGWNQLTVYFPDSGFSPKFAQPSWGAAKPWDASKVGELLFRVVPLNNTPLNFDLCVDNVKFQ